MATNEGTEGKFDVQSYLSNWYRADYPPSVNRITYITQLYNKYCRESLKSASANVSCLEIGSGATINSPIALVPHVSSFILSAYEEEGIKEVNLWRGKSQKAFNWSPFIASVLRHNGEDDGDSTVREREAEIRSKISNVIPCDLKRTGIIDQQYLPEGGFDIVVCIGVFCVAASTTAELNQMVANIQKLLKPGGFFLCRFGGRVSQCVGYVAAGSDKEQTIAVSALYITEDDARTAFSLAGFDILECSVHPVQTCQPQIFENLETMYRTTFFAHDEGGGCMLCLANSEKWSFIAKGIQYHNGVSEKGAW